MKNPKRSNANGIEEKIEKTLIDFGHSAIPAVESIELPEIMINRKIDYKDPEPVNDELTGKKYSSKTEQWKS